MSNVVKDLFTFVAATLTYYRFFALFVRIWQKQSLPFCCYCLLHSVWTYLKTSHFAHFVWNTKNYSSQKYDFWYFILRKSEKIVKIGKCVHKPHLTISIVIKKVRHFKPFWNIVTLCFHEDFSRVALECCSRCTHKSIVSKEMLKNAQNLITQWHCCLL